MTETICQQRLSMNVRDEVRTKIASDWPFRIGQRKEVGPRYARAAFFHILNDRWKKLPLLVEEAD